MRVLLIFCSFVSASFAETTFTRDIAPIFNKNCVSCHRAGDMAPMSLMDYKSARPWAKAIQEADLARDALIRQVTGAVQWVGSIQALLAAGVHTFVEVGPGKVLTGLLRQIDRTRTGLNVENEESLQKALGALASSA